MASGENMMDLALKITADPSQAEAAVQGFQEKVKSASSTVAESLRQQGASAEEVSQVYRQLGFRGERAGAEIKAAFGEAAAATQAAGKTAGEASENVYGMLSGLRHFRTIFAATIGLVSFGFWINEWGRLVDYLGDALQKLEGIRTVQDDIVMSAAFQALKQVTQEEQKQLMQPHSPRMARIYQEGIELHVQTLQRLKDEVEALQAGSLAGQEYAKAMADIAAHAREFGLQGPYGSIVESLEKQIEAYRALAVIEQEYEQRHDKTAKVTGDEARAAERLANARARLAEQESQFQFRGQLLNLSTGSEFTRQQTGIAEALGAQRFADLRAALAAYQSFEKAAASEEARTRAESAREEQRYLRSTEEAMRRHVQTMLALQKEIASGGSFAGVSFQALGQTFDQFNAGLREASQLSGVAISPITRLQFELTKLREASDMVGLSFQSFTQEIGRNAAMAIVYDSSFGQAMEKATKATLAQIAAQSFIWGLYYTAHGIADIFWNPPRAAADFAAAGEFFAIGGASAVVGAAIPAGGGGGAAAVANARGVSPQSSLGGSPGVAGNEGSPGVVGGTRHETILNIYGGVISTTDLQKVAEALNAGGQAGTIRVNASGSSYTLPNPVY
jgi:hypothetical protein